MEGPVYDPLDQLERLRRRRVKRRQIRRRRRLGAAATVIVAATVSLLAFSLSSAAAHNHVAVPPPTVKQLFAAEVRRDVSHLVIRKPVVVVVHAPALQAQPASDIVAQPQSVQPGRSVCPIPDWLRPAFAEAASESGVRLSLLTAVATVESHFDPDARSGAGATGIMQLMPETAASLGVDPADAAENVSGGARYLASLLDEFGSTDLALAAYNAGPGAVEAAGGAPSLSVLQYALDVSALDRLYSGCG